MKSTVFSMVPDANGKLTMEENHGKPALPIYSRVYGFGTGMNGNTYAVISEPDKNGRQELVSMTYPNDYKSHIDKYARPISKKFGIGLYWDDVEPDFRFSKEEVEKAIEAEKKAIAERERKEAEQAAADKAERQALPSRYPFLTPVTDRYDSKQAKANLVAHLKHQFPGVKFSVRKEHYDTYNIKWTNGPTQERVEKIAKLYQDHGADFTGDFWDYSPSNFNLVFGGFKFVFCQREMSEDIRALAEELKTFLPDIGEQEAREKIYKIFSSTFFPAGATNFHIEERKIRIEAMESIYGRYFAIDYDLPKKAPIKTQVEPGSIELIDYSQKAIAIVGDTKPIKDTLKKLGGKFNPRLKCGAGWIFPKTKEEQVKATLAI